MFGRYFKDASARYGSRTGPNYYVKNSTGSSAGESGLASRIERHASATELKESTANSSLAKGIAPASKKEPKDHIVNQMDIYSSDYHEDVAIGYSGGSALPQVRRVSPMPSSKPFGRSKPVLQSPRDIGARAVSLLLSPSTSDSSDDEASLVGKVRKMHGRLSRSISDHSVHSSALSEPRIPGKAAANPLRSSTRMSSFSPEPPALDEPPQTDPLMPVSDATPRIRRDVNKEKLERTRFPVI
jgi:hypothetical protein